MKLGGSVVGVDKHNVDEFINVCLSSGYDSVALPLDYNDPVSLIDEYVVALKQANIVLAEVGAWNCNLLHPDVKVSDAAFTQVVRQFEMAEYANAVCFVTVVGSESDIWDGPHPESFTKRVFERVVNTTVRILDAVNPQKTAFGYETMPWMLPDSPKRNLELIDAVNHTGFGVHLDIINMINSIERYYNNADFTRECFNLLSKHIKSIHLKDIILASNLTVHLSECMVGDGGYNLNAFFDEVVKLDKDIPVLTEHMDNQDDYKRSITYIRKFAKENGYKI